MTDTTLPPLFVSFVGNRKGQHSHGWVVLDIGPLTEGGHIETLCRTLELTREYDEGTIVVHGFRRLETADALGEKVDGGKDG